jgi:PilZ domain-containing protein
MATQPLEDTPARVERRDYPRKKIQVKIEIEWGAAVLTGSVRDIGTRGLFVELTPPLWIGARFRARLVVSPVLPLDCTVVRVEPSAGMAVTYEVPEENGKAQLEKILVGLAAA